MDIATLIKKVRLPMNRVAVSAIGLEFAIDGVHAVQVVSEDDGISIRHSSFLPYPGSREQAFEDLKLLSRLLRGVRKAGAFQGRRVIAALPAPQVKILQIQYPVKRDGSESRMILDLVSDRLPDPISEYVLDYIPVRNDNKEAQQQALVAVSRRSNVLDLLATLRQGGYEPHAIEINPVAIRRLVASLSNGSEQLENILIVNVGEQQTFLTMISGRRLLMDQEVSVGQRQMLDVAQKELELSESETLATIQRSGLSDTADNSAETRDQVQTLRLVLTPAFRHIADEIDQAFGYAASVTRGAPSRKIYLSGSIARWRGASEFLSDLTSVNVELFPSLFPDAAAFNNGGGAVAIGLAMRGMIEDV